MKEIHIISQLFLDKCLLKSKVKASAKNVHYRQGELDGACGAYSIAMALNIVGAFDADFLNKEKKKVDFRTAEGKLHKAIHDWGLFPDGLTTENCESIFEQYQKNSDYEVIVKNKVSAEVLREYLDKDIPLMLSINYSGGAHWIVVVGYELKNKKVDNFYTLDPGCALTTSSYWNGVLNTKKTQGKRYCYNYNTSEWDAMVSLDDAIAIWAK